MEIMENIKEVNLENLTQINEYYIFENQEITNERKKQLQNYLEQNFINKNEIKNVFLLGYSTNRLYY